MNSLRCSVSRLMTLRMSRADLAPRSFTRVQNRLQLRYANCLRSKDVVFQSGPLHWTIASTPGKNLTLEVAIKQADRFQAVLDDPLFFEDDRFYLTSCTGFTLAQKPFKSAHTLLPQSHSALAEAVLNGPDSVRAFGSTTRRKPPQKASPNLADLNGDIDTNLFAWFQPQISTDTGHIGGFEALARWRDNAGNSLSPATILPALENAGQMERLTDSILTQSLTQPQEMGRARPEHRHRWRQLFRE